MQDAEIIEAIEKTLGRRPTSVERLTGGANNVVARANLAGEEVLAKVYFTHARDPRDRLGTEFNTLTFFWEHGVRCVPRPIAMNRDGHLGIYEFVRGEKLVAGRVGWEEVRQLADFLALVWAIRLKPGAEKLPAASEAHFSLGKYCEHVEARLARVEAALKEDAKGRTAFDLAREQIRPALAKVSRFVAGRAGEYGLDLDAELPLHLRALNPADHGFHNALRKSDGRLVFLDFEYAGWDQAAQMLANACLQPEVPLPPDFRKPFLREMLKRLPGDGLLMYRLRLLYPLLSLKWSLIMLNEFVPVSSQRRSFAGANAETRLAAQLEKAKKQLEASLQAAADRFFLDDLIDEFDSQPLPS